MYYTDNVVDGMTAAHLPPLAAQILGDPTNSANSPEMTSLRHSASQTLYNHILEKKQWGYPVSLTKFTLSR
jgi:hypothetical protein